jgi:sugar/nucleoside kinase (ribokinase family)
MILDSKKQPLLIVGSLAFDSVETPASRVDMALGGSASFAAIAASYFARPLVVGIVGDDFGDEHMERFREHDIDVAGVERVPGRTFHWKGRYHSNFKERDTLETALNVFASFDPEIPEAYRRAPFVFLGNIAPELQLKVLEQTKGARLVAMDTMNFWIETARDALGDVLGRVDILIINDEEALQLSEEGSVLEAARSILARGPKYVVIKRGEYGAVLFGRDITLCVPGVPLANVVDPTGAGDTFAGGFVGHLTGSGGLDRATLGRALVSGTVLASFAVEAFSVDGICRLSPDALAARRRLLEDMIRY